MCISVEAMMRSVSKNSSCLYSTGGGWDSLALCMCACASVRTSAACVWEKGGGLRTSSLACAHNSHQPLGLTFDPSISQGAVGRGGVERGSQKGSLADLLTPLLVRVWTDSHIDPCLLLTLTPLCLSLSVCLCFGVKIANLLR